MIGSYTSRKSPHSAAASSTSESRMYSLLLMPSFGSGCLQMYGPLRSLQRGLFESVCSWCRGSLRAAADGWVDVGPCAR